VSGGDCSCPDAAAAVGSQRNIFALYESTGRQLNSLTAETLIDLEATYGEEWVCEAIKRANDRGRVNIGYIKGILDSWRAGGGIDNPDRDKTPSGRKMTKAEQDFNKSINMLKEWAEK
jgi:DnaD/phage-associated family protein